MLQSSRPRPSMHCARNVLGNPWPRNPQKIMVHRCFSFLWNVKNYPSPLNVRVGTTSSEDAFTLSLPTAILSLLLTTRTIMPLVKLFAHKNLSKAVPLARLQTKLCDIWGTKPDESFAEDVYVDIRAYGKLILFWVDRCFRITIFVHS